MLAAHFVVKAQNRGVVSARRRALGRYINIVTCVVTERFSTHGKNVTMVTATSCQMDVVVVVE